MYSEVANQSLKSSIKCGELRTRRKFSLIKLLLSLLCSECLLLRCTRTRSESATDTGKTAYLKNKEQDRISHSGTERLLLGRTRNEVTITAKVIIAARIKTTAQAHKFTNFVSDSAKAVRLNGIWACGLGHLCIERLLRCHARHTGAYR